MAPPKAPKLLFSVWYSVGLQRLGASIWTLVPFHVFFYMDPLPDGGGHLCYLQVSTIGPPTGPTREDLAVFRLDWVG